MLRCVDCAWGLRRILLGLVCMTARGGSPGGHIRTVMGMPSTWHCERYFFLAVGLLLSGAASAQTGTQSGGSLALPTTQTAPATTPQLNTPTNPATVLGNPLAPFGTAPALPGAPL